MAKGREEDRRDLIADLRDREERREAVEDLVNAYVALQIKTLRQQRGWTQSELAENASIDGATTRQSQISQWENVNNPCSLDSLKRLAAAFDLPLIVKFGHWREFVDSTFAMNRAALERVSFEKDHTMVGSPAESNVVSFTRPVARGATGRVPSKPSTRQ